MNILEKTEPWETSELPQVFVVTPLGVEVAALVSQTDLMSRVLPWDYLMIPGKPDSPSPVAVQRQRVFTDQVSAKHEFRNMVQGILEGTRQAKEKGMPVQLGGFALDIALGAFKALEASLD